MLTEEVSDVACPRLLQILQRRPTQEQSRPTTTPGVGSGKPCEHLGKVHFELRGQPVEITRLVIDGLAACFNQ